MKLQYVFLCFLIHSNTCAMSRVASSSLKKEAGRSIAEQLHQKSITAAEQLHRKSITAADILSFPLPGEVLNEIIRQYQLLSEEDIAAEIGHTAREIHNRAFPERSLYKEHLPYFIGLQKKYSIDELLRAGKIPAVKDTVLKLRDLNISSLDGLSRVPGIAQVRDLDLARNKLTVIPQGAFLALPHLERLDLEMNRIEEIEPKAFEGLAHLGYLLLADQWSEINLPSLRNLKKDIFSNLLRLRLVDLHRNYGLENLDPDLFKSQKKLKLLVLEQTGISPERCAQLQGEIRKWSPEVRVRCEERSA